MQLNSALFSLNGGTGYVLKPEWMRDPTKKKPAKKNIRIRVNNSYLLETAVLEVLEF